MSGNGDIHVVPAFTAGSEIASAVYPHETTTCVRGMEGPVTTSLRRGGDAEPTRAAVSRSGTARAPSRGSVATRTIGASMAAGHVPRQPPLGYAAAADASPVRPTWSPIHKNRVQLFEAKKGNHAEIFGFMVSMGLFLKIISRLWRWGWSRPPPWPAPSRGRIGRAPCQFEL
jgi:hypothetical protein